MPFLKRCCCCMDLRGGSLLIGIISMVLIGFVEIAVAIYCLLNVTEAKKKIKFKNAFIIGITDEDSDAAAYVFFAMLLVVAVIYVIVCALLIHGVRTKKRFLLLPWTLFTFMNMIMAIAGAILTLINSLGYALPIIVGVIVLIIAVLWIYFCCVVFSFFQALHDGDYW